MYHNSAQGKLQIPPTDLCRCLYIEGFVVELTFTTLFATVLFCPANTTSMLGTSAAFGG